MTDDPTNRSAARELSTVSQKLGTNVKEVLATAIGLAPAARETAEALEVINHEVAELDTLSIHVAAGMHEPCNGGKTYQIIQSEQADVCNTIESCTQAVLHAVDNKNEKELSSCLLSLTAEVPKLTATSKQIVGTISDAVSQQDNVSNCSFIMHALHNVLEAARSCAFNPRDEQAKSALASSQHQVNESISTLLSSLKGDVLAEFDNAIKAVTDAMSLLAKPISSVSVEESYQRAESSINKSCKALVADIMNLVRTARADADKLGLAAREAAKHMHPITSAMQVVLFLSTDKQMKQKLHATAAIVGKAVLDTLQDAKKVAEDSSNQGAQQKLAGRTKQLSGSVAQLAAALRAGNKAERDLESAIEAVGKYVSDLSNAALFAAAGQLEVELEPSKSLIDYYNALLASVEQATSVGARIVESYTKTRQDLGQVAKLIESIVHDMTTSSKAVARHLSDPDHQQRVMNGAKSLAEVLQVLIRKSMAANSDAHNQDLQNEVVSAVASLPQTSKSYQAQTEEVARGLVGALQAIGTSAAAINKEVEVFGARKGNNKAAPQDVVESARTIAKANAELTASATTSQEELIQTSKESAVQISAAVIRLLSDASGASKISNDITVQKEICEGATSTALATVDLLTSVQYMRPNDSNSVQHISGASAVVVTHINELVSSLRKLPGAQDLELEETDLAELAERELLAAAAAIEASAQRLLSRGAAEMASLTLDESQIAESVLEAARAITSATITLVKAATVVQREIAATGKVHKALNPYKKDPAWAEGLISAAQAVAGTTEDMVDVANDAARGSAGQDLVVAAVQAVGGATARLVAASRAKANPNSPSQQKLTVAARTVTAATKSLAAAVKKSSEPAPMKRDAEAAKKRRAMLKEQEKINRLQRELDEALAAQQESASKGGVTGRAKAFQEQEKINQLTKELEEAREAQRQRRKNEYK